jgi:hypothetical protein
MSFLQSGCLSDAANKSMPVVGPVRSSGIEPWLLTHTGGVKMIRYWIENGLVINETSSPPERGAQKARTDGVDAGVLVRVR